VTKRPQAIVNHKRMVFIMWKRVCYQ